MGAWASRLLNAGDEEKARTNRSGLLSHVSTAGRWTKMATFANQIGIELRDLWVCASKGTQSSLCSGDGLLVAQTHTAGPVAR
jgi:hypothetical protein